MPMTAGTKTAETLSAMRAIGAFVAAASLTMRMICAKDVSSPTRVAFAWMYPFVLIEAARTASPIPLSTGTDSPVSAASSSAAVPDRISPSTGTASPGFTRKMSPTLTSLTGRRISSPFRRSSASFGAILMSDFSASVVRPFDRASRSLPTVMSAGIIAADSK